MVSASISSLLPLQMFTDVYSPEVLGITMQSFILRSLTTDPTSCVTKVNEFTFLVYSSVDEAKQIW